jgi:hypothetical protein
LRNKDIVKDAIKERIASDKKDEVIFVSGIAGTLTTN